MKNYLRYTLTVGAPVAAVGIIAVPVLAASGIHGTGNGVHVRSGKVDGRRHKGKILN